jgi:hypothetical protein
VPPSPPGRPVWLRSSLPRPAGYLHCLLPGEAGEGERRGRCGRGDVSRGPRYILQAGQDGAQAGVFYCYQRKILLLERGDLSGDSKIDQG